MSIVNHILFFLIGLTFILMALGFLIVIARNVKQGQIFRRNLAQRIESLRLNKMLDALGIGTSRWLHQASADEILRAAIECKHCETTQTCDLKLEQGKLDISQIEFCPNHAKFVRFLPAKNPDA